MKTCRQEDARLILPRNRHPARDDALEVLFVALLAQCQHELPACTCTPISYSQSPCISLYLRHRQLRSHAAQKVAITQLQRKADATPRIPAPPIVICNHASKASWTLLPCSISSIFDMTFLDFACRAQTLNTRLCAHLLARTLASTTQ